VLVRFGVVWCEGVFCKGRKMRSKGDYFITRFSDAIIRSLLGWAISVFVCKPSGRWVEID
jgi:hypothetical protein